MLKRVYAIFRARNLEFVRDRSSLSWNIILPVALMFGLSFIFSGGTPPDYTVGVLQGGEEVDPATHPFLETRHIQFVPVQDPEDAMSKVARHQLDMLVSFDGATRYWVNPESSKGYFVEFALLQTAGNEEIAKEQIRGEAVRYIDWVLPGILGMNMMFSCLFGVGYVVVRYRKSGFLRRLSATPVTAFEFGVAQVLSRLLLTVSVTALLYAALALFVPFRNEGSVLVLLLVAVLGALAMIAFGFMMAARFASEELANGAINLASWPMMLLSGVWFSLEGAPAWLQAIARALPLTQMLDAARAVMLDGAGLVAVLPNLGWLAAMTLLFLGISAAGFRWRAD